MRTYDGFFAVSVLELEAAAGAADEPDETVFSGARVAASGSWWDFPRGPGTHIGGF